MNELLENLQRIKSNKVRVGKVYVTIGQILEAAAPRLVVPQLDDLKRNLNERIVIAKHRPEYKDNANYKQAVSWLIEVLNNLSELS